MPVVLPCPASRVSLQRFDPASLGYLRARGVRARRVQRIDGNAVNDKTGKMIDQTRDDYAFADVNPVKPTSLIADAHKAGLFVHSYTLRNEAHYLPGKYEPSRISGFATSGIFISYFRSCQISSPVIAIAFFREKGASNFTESF